jgi:cytochrome c biogenesis protein CcmG/thiol:disulfide interchange protein DsbE
MRRLLFIAPLVLFAGLIVAFAVGLQRDPSLIPSVLIDKPLPAFDLPPVRAAGPGLKSGDLSGEPRLLNVFASWCVACREEHSMLLQLAQTGVPIEGLDWKDDPAAAERLLSEQGDPYERVGADRSGRTGVDLGVTGAPETFIVDRRGRVRYKQIGPIDPKTWTRTIAPLMEKLRAER